MSLIIKNKISLKKDSFKKYNRAKVKTYLKRYSLKPNKRYNYNEKNDSTNFASQVLYAGGINHIGENINDYNAWFCERQKGNKFIKESITWGVAKYFREYWRKQTEVLEYREVTVKYALENFNNIYNFLNIGDIIQYASIDGEYIPYHTQIIYKKTFNKDIKRTDLLMAQHTTNSKKISLYKYLLQISKINNSYIYIYKIKI